MKGLKEFLESLKGNEALKAEVEKVQDDAKKVVEVAKKNGYSFTENEYMDAKMDAVSGGDKSWMEIGKDVFNKFTGGDQGGATQGQGAAVPFASDGYHYSRNGDYAIGMDGTVCRKDPYSGAWQVIG